VGVHKAGPVIVSDHANWVYREDLHVERRAFCL
jgi:hypothetical protein